MSSSQSGLENQLPQIAKICLIGDGGTGKTSLRKSFCGEGFPVSYNETIGAEFASRNILVGFDPNIDPKPLKVQIWDLAGQPRFQSVRQIFYKGAVGALLVFDITRPETFESAVDWVREFWRHNEHKDRKMPFHILGNKTDARYEKVDGRVLPCVPARLGRVLAKEFSKLTWARGFEVLYFETSAKNGINVEVAFQALATSIARLSLSALDVSKLRRKEDIQSYIRK